MLHRYNLQSLMKKDFTVTNTNGLNYKFKVCRAVNDNLCKAGTGIAFYQTFNVFIVMVTAFIVIALNMIHSLFLDKSRSVQCKTRYFVGPS